MSRRVFSRDTFKRVACKWRINFEPLAKKNIRIKFSVLDGTWLNFEEGHPLHRKVSCSADGLFENKNGVVSLLEIKCP